MSSLGCSMVRQVFVSYARDTAKADAIALRDALARAAAQEASALLPTDDPGLASLQTRLAVH